MQAIHFRASSEPDLTNEKVAAKTGIKHYSRNKNRL